MTRDVLGLSPSLLPRRLKCWLGATEVPWCPQGHFHLWGRETRAGLMGEVRAALERAASSEARPEAWQYDGRQMTGTRRGTLRAGATTLGRTVSTRRHRGLGREELCYGGFLGSLSGSRHCTSYHFFSWFFFYREVLTWLREPFDDSLKFLSTLHGPFLFFSFT